MKKYLAAALGLAIGIGILRVPIMQAVTASYNETVRVVSSTGTVLDGVASAVTANYQKTVRIVDSTGHVIDSFGGGSTVSITAATGGKVSPSPITGTGTVGTANVPTGVFNVITDYGAAGDCSTNDQTAIQNAINAATAVGGAVYVPIPSGGCYVVGDHLTITSATANLIHLYGDAGGQATYGATAQTTRGPIIKFTGTPGGANTACTSGAGSGAIQINSNVAYAKQQVEIDHLQLLTTNAGLGCVINASGGFDQIFYLHDTSIYSSIQTHQTGQVTAGIWLGGPIEDRIIHNTFANMDKFDIGLESGFGWNAYSIEKNLFLPLLEPANYDIDLTGQSQQAGNIVDNTFEGQFGAVQLNGINASAGFQGGRISGNWFGDGTTGAGIDIKGSFTGTEISGNYFSNGLIGIQANGGAGLSATISGNEFQDYNTDGLQLGSGSWAVHGNHFRPVAAGATAAIEVQSGGDINAGGNGFSNSDGSSGDSYLLDSGSTGFVTYLAANDQTTGGIVDNSAGGVSFIKAGAATFPNINKVVALGAIGSGGTATCNMTGASICTLSVGAGSWTMANPTNVTAGVEYQAFITLTAAVSDAWGNHWRYASGKQSKLIQIPTNFIDNVYVSASFNTVVQLFWHYDGTSFVIDNPLPDIVEVQGMNVGGSGLTVSGGGATITGSVGVSGGGISTTDGRTISTTGGTKPTCACTGGSPTCTVANGGTNNRGQIQMTGATAATTCTLTFTAGLAFPQAPICLFSDANASSTALAYSAGAIGTSTAVVDFAAASAANINYVCM